MTRPILGKSRSILQLDRAVITTGQDSLESDSEETARAGPRGR